MLLGLSFCIPVWEEIYGSNSLACMYKIKDKVSRLEWQLSSGDDMRRILKVQLWGLREARELKNVTR